jgi:hypothetical protein
VFEPGGDFADASGRILVDRMDGDPRNGSRFPIGHLPPTAPTTFRQVVPDTPGCARGVGAGFFWARILSAWSTLDAGAVDRSNSATTRTHLRQRRKRPHRAGLSTTITRCARH